MSVLGRKGTRSDAEATGSRQVHDPVMADGTDVKLCRLERSLGHERACPEEGCPFWSSGAEERQGHCAFDGVDLNGREDLAGWLLELRGELEGREGAERDATRSSFYRRLNEGRAD